MQAIQKPAAPGNYAVGRKNRISRITFHHIVGNAEAAIARFQTPGEQVSATYVIGADGRLYQCVDENNTPYTDANADSNSRAITIEHAGGSPSVPYTEAMYQASIALVRELIGKYGINDFKRHREVSDVPTACPGTLDVERIVREAKEDEDVKMSKDDVKAMFPALIGEQATDTDIKRWEGAGWDEFTKAVSSDPRVVVGDKDVDIYFAKWIARPVTKQDRDYWRGKSQARLVRAILKDPSSVSVNPDVQVNGVPYVPKV